jgi:hypothetical protein
MKQPKPNKKQKQPAILRQLREQIVGGKWSPGQRLPSRGEFEISTGTSRVTVQKIFDKLAQEGFVEVNGRRETRVASDPPHLSRYALAFPSDPTLPNRWNRFWTVLSDVSVHVRRKDGTPAVQIFRNIDGHSDVREFGQLLTAARHHLVAGMIFPGPSPLLLQSPLVKETDIPRVLISRPTPHSRESGSSIVTTDTATFYEKACSYLKQRGCSSVAILMQSGESFEDKVAPSLARHQLQCPAYWLHRILPESATTVTSILHLMMRHPAERPQGLIIADDHFTGPATMGLLAAGVRVPDDLEVVVHENFPAQSQSLLPFRRLGFDVRELLRASIELIDQQRQGAPPGLVIVSAGFEDELPDAQPASN